MPLYEFTCKDNSKYTPKKIRVLADTTIEARKIAQSRNYEIESLDIVTIADKSPLNYKWLKRVIAYGVGSGILLIVLLGIIVYISIIVLTVILNAIS